MLLTPQLVASLYVASMIHGSKHHHADDTNHQHDDVEHELRIAQCADPCYRSGVNNLTTIVYHADNHQYGIDASREHH